jgi:seryl-tRNA synthetase
MHDLRAIREDPKAFDAGLARRGLEPVAALVLELDEQRRENEKIHQAQLAERNATAKAIGAAKAAGNEVLFNELRNKAQLRTAIGNAAEDVAKQRAGEINELLAALPNIPADDVPNGADESGNEELARWGQQRNFAFDPKEHADLGPPLGLDFETAAAMSGARFAFLRGQMARLHRALAQFMLDFHTAQRGYEECNPPLLVRDEAVFGTGQLPKFADDLFRTMRVPPPLPQPLSLENLANIQASNIAEDYAANIRDFETGPDSSDPDEWPTVWSIKRENLRAIIPGHWLIPTAEVSLTNSVREQILDDLASPIRLTALTPCFRSEAGAAGKDTRGFIRQHQFEKVELVAICRPEDWQDEHEHMVRSAELVLEALELPYRRMLLCAGDMGATAKKTFDLEVWLPGQGAYREISSVSWCGDYQARRMNARYRPEGQKGTAFVHTLNGSGLAVGRTLVAVLENYQEADGSVTVPAALTPYMGGVGQLVPAA